MKNSLKSFEIPSGYQGIKNKISFKMQSNLVVLTGLNGSGKTSLLRYIKEKYSQEHKIFFKTQSNNEGINNNYNSPFLRKRYSRYQEIEIPTFDSVMENLERLFIKVYKYKNQFIHKHEIFSALFDNTSHLYDKGYDFLEAVCKELDPLDDLNHVKKKMGVPTDEQIKNEMINKLNHDSESKSKYNYTQGKRFYDEYLNKDSSTEYTFLEDLEEKITKDLKVSLRKNAKINTKEVFENYIHELVVNYSFSIESIIEKISNRIYEDSKGKIAKGKRLWEIINQELAQYHHSHFKYFINAPNQFSTNYEISFKSIDGNDKHVHFDLLSSGEKIIFELLCYYIIANKDDTLELIILDEFDANLNPALVNIYLDVIKKQFCEKDIRVILTTHSPSTVAELEPREIFELSIEKNTQKLTCAQDEEGKKTILKKLAPKFVYHSEFGNLEYVLNDRTDRIVLVEGKNDVKNFSNCNDFTFIHCDGANNIKNLLICFKSIEFFKNILKNKLLIALFDFDGKGRKTIKTVLETHLDDDFTKKILSKKSPYIYDKKNKRYIATFKPKNKEDAWDYQENPIEHRALKESEVLLQTQKDMLHEILQDWKENKECS